MDNSRSASGTDEAGIDLIKASIAACSSFAACQVVLAQRVKAR